MTRREGCPPLSRLRRKSRLCEEPMDLNSIAKFGDIEGNLDSLCANYTLKCKQPPTKMTDFRFVNCLQLAGGQSLDKVFRF